MVNPHMAHEHRTRHVPPAVCSRKVLVVGGGVAGLEAAITAADRGHKVVLVEKAEELGGVIRFADYDSIKVQLKKYLQISGSAGNEAKYRCTLEYRSYRGLN